MRHLALPLAILFLLLAACGDRGPVRRAGPLGPELYEIDEDDRPQPGEFLRYAPPGPKGGGLDIAVTHYEHPEGLPPLSLVGVVHVADPPYFERMQALLDAYDVVLYEAVKPGDLDVETWQAQARETQRSTAGLQRQLASWFGFVYQLDALDYGRKNLVHADMTLEEFEAAGGGDVLPIRSGEDGEEDLPASVKKTLDAVRDLGEAAFGRDGPLRSMARRMFAETMGTTDIGDALDMMPGLSDLILVQRNEVAMAKLMELLPDLSGRRTAIFYGAAHMPDLETRVKELGYERTTGYWLRAWALRAPLER